MQLINGIKRFIFYTYNVSLLFTLNSCDPSDFSLPAYNADFYVPMLNIELSTSDLMLADTLELFREDSTGLVSLYYNASESRKLEDIAPISDTKENFTIPGIPGDIPDFEVKFPVFPILLNIDTGFYQVFDPAPFNYEGKVDIQEFISAHFDKGLIELEIKNNFPFILDAGLVIELQNEGEEVPFFQFNLDTDLHPGESYIFENQTLDNKYLTNSFIVRIVDLHISGGTNIIIDPFNNINIDISFQQISLDKATFKQPDIEIPGFKIDLPLIFSIGSRINKGRLDGGFLSFEIPEIDPVFTLTLRFPTVQQDGHPFTLNFNGNKMEASLNGVEIELLTRVIDTLFIQDTLYNILPVEIQLGFNDALETFDIEFNKALSGQIAITDIDYDYLLGYLGRLYDLLEIHEEPDIFDPIRFGSLGFEDPRITIGISNGIGATGQIYDDGKGVYIKGKNERLHGDTEISFGNSLNGFTLPPAFAKGSPSYSVYTLSQENEPGFRQFLSIFPTTIDVRIPVSAGTSEIEMDQFLYDDDLIGVDLGLELPLSVSADRLIISDTIEFALDINAEKYEVLRMSLEARFQNYFPLELTFQTLFLDENYTLLDSLFKEFKVVNPATIGTDGKVTNPLVEDFLILLDKKDLDLIKNVAYAVPVIKMNTPEGQYVKLFSSYKLRIQLKGELLTDINLTQ